MELQAAARIARQLMDFHGLGSWSFGFDAAQRRFGSCDYGAHRITLSAPLVERNREAIVLNVVRHEVAHALTPGHHHDVVWQAKDRELGGTGQRCYDPAEVSRPPARFVARCPNCGKESPTMRRRGAACRRCCDELAGGEFDARFQLRYFPNPHQEAPRPAQVLKARALADFVGIRAAARQDIRRLEHEHALSAIAIGTILLRVKKELPHGEYEHFITEDLGYSRTTARTYRELAQAPDAKKLAELGDSKAGLLLRKSFAERTRLFAQHDLAALTYRALYNLLFDPPTVRARRQGPTIALPTEGIPTEHDLAFSNAAGMLQLKPGQVSETTVALQYEILAKLFDPGAGHVPTGWLQHLNDAKSYLDAALFARRGQAA